MNILLVDDHPLFLDGLHNLLVSRGFTVAGAARDGLEAVAKARELRPDVVLMDIHMPRLDGVSALRLLKTELPDIKIIMLTMSAEDEDLFEAIKSGASGFLLKTQDTDEIFELLADVAQGGVPLSPGLAGRILQELGRQQTVLPAITQQPPVSLSAREMEVMTLVAEGLTYREVGARLGITERTIKYHMGEIIRRLQLKNRAEVLEYARRVSLTGLSSAHSSPSATKLQQEK